MFKLRVLRVKGKVVNGEAAHIAPGVFLLVVPADSDRPRIEFHKVRGLNNQVLRPFALNIDTVFGLNPNHLPFISLSCLHCTRKPGDNNRSFGQATR